jgi:2-amino-4-hydroxy-6-hydroxymethyldihydropteridine diphosphokinase
MTTAFIGLGSNLGNPQEASLATPKAQLCAALDALNDLAFSRLRRVSSFYQTPPWGDADQPPYCNAVAELHTELSADALLRALQAIENAQGRVRDAARPLGPRSLDLDLLLYGAIKLNSVDLTVPHPRMHQRAFVLVPLLEIAPDSIIPGLGKASLALSQLDATDIQRLEDQPWATSIQT